MREIKFRAWDKKRKEMGIVEEFDFNKGVSVRSEKTKKGWYVYLESGNIELMQFTSLKDKNGKEIYEGDILDVDMFGYTIKSEVEWCPGGFWGIEHSDSKRTIPVRKSEIIGNIYENPELLKT